MDRRKPSNAYLCPFVGFLVWLVVTTIFFATISTASAQQSYRSTDAAAEALASAARRDSRREILMVLGSLNAEIAMSGDQVADSSARQRFATAYQTKHQIRIEGDKKATLIIGADDFQFPVPLIRKGDRWQFDPVAGRLELQTRRISANERSAIQTCSAYFAAQKKYAGKDRTGLGAGIYAGRMSSTVGRMDGLYWPTSKGEEESPLGEFAARAAAGGYRDPRADTNGSRSPPAGLVRQPPGAARRGRACGASPPR